MTMLKFHWFIPTNGGDGRSIVGGGHGVAPGTGDRPPSVPYLGQIARSAEQLGFEAALCPTGGWCDDAWITASMLSSVSQRLKFLVALRPGLIAPYLTAQMAGTFQNLSGGRLYLNVVAGGESVEQRMFGDFLDKDERYQRCDEFLHLVRALWRGETVTFEGAHFRIEKAALRDSHIPHVPPMIYFGGSSPSALKVAARHADVYLTWGESPDAVADKIREVRKLATDEGRELKFGIRLHTIARDTSHSAWAEAERLLSHVSREEIERLHSGRVNRESEGQRRMLALSGGSIDNLEIYPNLWAGVGLVRAGAGTAMVGSFTEIADLVEKYAQVGIEEFILSGYPHLEESYWFGEGVLPELARRGRWAGPFQASPAAPVDALVSA